MKRRDFVLATLIAGATAPVLGAVRAAPGNGLSQVNTISLLGAHALRAARAWLQIGMDVDAARAAQLLTQSLKAFEAGYAEYRGMAGRAGLLELPLMLEQRWRAFEISASSPPTPQGARRVLPLSEELFLQSEKGAAEFARRSANPMAAPLLKAGRARALTQQMARFALSRRWGVSPADAPIYLDKSRAEFPRIIAELLAQPGNAPAITGQLQLAQQQWVFFDKALTALEDPNAPAAVVAQAERFFGIMQTLVAAYA